MAIRFNYSGADTLQMAHDRGLSREVLSCCRARHNQRQVNDKVAQLTKNLQAASDGQPGGSRRAPIRSGWIFLSKVTSSHNRIGTCRRATTSVFTCGRASVCRRERACARGLCVRACEHVRVRGCTNGVDTYAHTHHTETDADMCAHAGPHTP
jgi:hypothetical protein